MSRQGGGGWLLEVFFLGALSKIGKISVVSKTEHELYYGCMLNDEWDNIFLL